MLMAPSKRVTIPAYPHPYRLGYALNVSAVTPKWRIGNGMQATGDFLTLSISLFDPELNVCCHISHFDSPGTSPAVSRPYLRAGSSQCKGVFNTLLPLLVKAKCKCVSY